MASARVRRPAPAPPVRRKYVRRFPRRPDRRPDWFDPSAPAPPDSEIGRRRKRKVLRVDGGNFVAGALWERFDEGWSCVDCAPILKWMRGLDPDRVKDYLGRRGWTYTWLDDAPHVRESADIPIKKGL